MPAEKPHGPTRRCRHVAAEAREAGGGLEGGATSTSLAAHERVLDVHAVVVGLERAHVEAQRVDLHRCGAAVALAVAKTGLGLRVPVGLRLVGAHGPRQRGGAWERLGRGSGLGPGLGAERARLEAVRARARVGQERAYRSLSDSR